MINRCLIFTLFIFFSVNTSLIAGGYNEGQEELQNLTVACYLKMRLESLGLKRLFGVAGNYTAPFLDTILEDPEGEKIKITGTSNEICAGYAADGYARIQGEKGLGAVAVTYGVGAFSLLNAIAGSFVEQVPIVVINGAPTNKEFSNQRFGGLLSSHMVPNPEANINIYRSVTVAAERISNANEAPFQIDTALTACISRRQPVYLEILEDVWRAECTVPVNIKPLIRLQLSVTKSDINAAVEATFGLMKEYMNKGKSKPMFWAGVEIQRLGLQVAFENLLKVSHFPYTTSILGKSLISEDTENFSAVGLPKNASCVIGLGSLTTGKEVGNKSIIGDRDKVIVSQGNAFVGGAFFPNVSLEGFIAQLQERFEEAEQSKGKEKLQEELLTEEPWAEPDYPSLNTTKTADNDNDILNYDNFFKTLNEQWIKDSVDTTVVVDSSFPLIASQQGVHIKSPNGFVSQAAWLSIGYAAPAAIGIKCAIEDNGLEDKRMIVIAGDGAFQETCQAVSSYVQLKHNTVVFVLANGIYGIEQKLVNPNPFRHSPNEDSDKNIYTYNELCPWNYEKLVTVFGEGEGHVVENIKQLQDVLSAVQKDLDKNFIIHVKIPKLSVPLVLNHTLKEAGEDELKHPNWPDSATF
jgi:Pyruvate decarboxylase and related thiamine pyrophosphate-requiring enzymes